MEFSPKALLAKSRTSLKLQSLILNITKGDTLILSIFLIGILSIIHLIFLRTDTTFSGNAIRMQGILLLWNLLIFTFVSSRFKLPKINPLVPFFSLITLLISAILLNNNAANRAVATLGEPNALGATAIFFWPFLFFANGKKYGLVYKISSLLLAIMIIFLSKSGSALLALVIQTAIIGMTHIFKTSLPKITILAVMILFISFSLPFFQKKIWYENRVQIWKTATFAGFMNPVIGGGFGNIETQMTKASQFLNNFVKYQYVDSAHNFLLDWWIQTGIIGFIVILILITKSLKNFANEKREREVVLLLGILTVMSFNPVSIATLIAFWWLIGQAFCYINTNEPLQTPTRLN